MILFSSHFLSRHELIFINQQLLRGAQGCTRFEETEFGILWSYMILDLVTNWKGV